MLTAYILLSAYVIGGLVLTIHYQWDEIQLEDGFELMLDVLLWPVVLYYFIRYS
jgi:hypothetical protein